MAAGRNGKTPVTILKNKMFEKQKITQLLENKILTLIARIILGGLFIIASLDKIIDPNAFATSILNYRVIGESLSMLVATILPWLELICGLGLVFGFYARANAGIITTLLICFIILIVSALVRGLDISCGCFSQDPNVSKIGYQKILENIGLIILSIYLFYTSNRQIKLISIFRKQSAN